jgi:hypothetical protein
MRITLRTVGGFSGPAGAETRTLDLDTLAPEKAVALRGLVESARFFLLPPTVRKARPRSWDFLHTLTVEDGDRSHQVTFHLDAVDARLRELVRAVEADDPA